MSNTIWAITAYFNSAGYASRLANYKTFRRHLSVPLVTVELCAGGRCELEARDADVLVQLCAGDALWQKERLLNVALRHVPSGCEHIAWLDCDIVFDDDAWSREASAMLRNHALVQPWAEYRETRSPAAGTAEAPRLIRRRSSLARFATAHRDVGDDPAKYVSLFSPGLAWVGRRRELERHGFYDSCIVGGGDRALAFAAFGWIRQCAESLRMTRVQTHHYRRWAEPYFRAVAGRVGYVDVSIRHLWHGDRADRRYAERHDRLCDFDFDPTRDIVVDRGGAWRFTQQGRRMKPYLQQYFATRREDG